MTAQSAPAGTGYTLRLAGYLDHHWVDWFDGPVITHEADGTTRLDGTVVDQAQLHGLLDKVRDLGATLIAVETAAASTRRAEDCNDVPVSSSLDALKWPVHTDRLLIRPAQPGDADATWRFRRLDEVSRWITRAPTTFEDYRKRFEDPDSLGKTLIVERDGEVIGDLMLQIEDAWAQAEVADQARGVQAELGWVLHPDQSGKGHATEAVAELIRICFEELGLRRVTANCFAANESSWRLMERLGMRREISTVRDSLHRSGEWLDGIGYALLADEFRGNV
jgi:RimJ/RimL family protein N-acetyltransferase